MGRDIGKELEEAVDYFERKTGKKRKSHSTPSQEKEEKRGQEEEKGLVKIIGKLEEVTFPRHSKSFYLIIQDKNNKFLVAEYEYGKKRVTLEVYSVLRDRFEEGKKRIQILVEGPLEPNKVYYKGIGSPKILDGKK